MFHVRHEARRHSGLCETVLITHGEGDRCGVGHTSNIVAAASFAGRIDHKAEAHHLHQVWLGCTGMVRASLSPLLPPC